MKKNKNRISEEDGTMRTRAITALALMAFLLALCMPNSSDAAEWEYSSTRMELTKNLGADAGSNLEIEEESTAAIPGKKNIGRALMFSLILPGTGQLYAGPWWRALPWIAVEAASWTVFAVYHKKGQDKTDEFEDFADEHFSRARYDTAEQDIRDDNDGELPDNFTHELPPTNNQQYYEMIGKYIMQFGFGWEDAYETDEQKLTLFFDGTTTNFYDYRDMRAEANDLLSIANIGMEIVLVNHIISALEAAFLVRQHNRRLETTQSLGHLMYERREINGADTRLLTLRIPIH